AAGAGVLSGAQTGLVAIHKAALSQRAAPARPQRQNIRRSAVLEAAGGRSTIHEADSKSILSEQGITITKEVVVDDLEAAAKAAATVGYPVVLKIVSDHVPHKTERGLVILNIQNRDELESAWQTLSERLAQAGDVGQARFLVQEMVRGGVEVFAGILVDPTFGPFVLFGLGGIAIEAMGEYALRALPLREGDAEAMIAETRAATMLRGIRGAPAADQEALADCIYKLADFAWSHRDHIGGIDINPIKVLPHGSGYRIVDALIIPAKDQAASARSQMRSAV
ncbi:MAG: acetate--CoA ligase family protein, partial [Pseudorhodoplanes sp.]